MKRTVIAIMLLLAACGGSTAPTPSLAPAKPVPSSAGAKPVASISISPGKISSFYSTVSATFAPMWIAKEAGIFQKNGLDVDVQLIQNPQGTAALIAEQVQIGLGGAADILGPVTSGADLQLLATMTPTYPYVFEVAEAIKTPADLKGQKLGVSQAGGSDYVAMQAMLGKLGLDSSRDVNILFVGGIPQRTAALIGGNVAGTLTSPPETLVIEARGYHPLVDLTALNLPAASSTLMAHKSWIQANHSAVQKFVDSLIEGIAREKSDRAYAEQIMGKYLKLEDKAALDATYDFFALKILPNLPDVKPDQFKDAVETIGRQNEKVRSLDVRTIIDNSFVEDAAKRGLATK